MIVRVNKSDNYTVMSNYHLKDRYLSLKAKGLLSVVLSLPEDWEYSIQGLASISRENETSIKSALKELKENGYLIITKRMPNETNSGRIEYEWDFYECSHAISRSMLTQRGKKQEVENQPLEILTLENQPQLNTKESNTKVLNTEGIDIYGKPKSSRFVPPSVDEVRDYCQERNNLVDPEKFVDYYTARGWKIGKNSMKDWRAAVRTWERNNYSTTQNASPASSNPFTELKRKEGWS